MYCLNYLQFCNHTEANDEVFISKNEDAKINVAYLLRELVLKSMKMILIFAFCGYGIDTNTKLYKRKKKLILKK